MTAGELIKARRVALRLTQRQLAAAIGVTHSYINKLEKGFELAKRDRCAALARVLDVPFAELWNLTAAARQDADLKRIRLRGDLAELTAEEARRPPAEAPDVPAVLFLQGDLSAHEDVEIIRTGGDLPDTLPPVSQPASIDEFVREMTADPKRLRAHRDLALALRDPGNQAAILSALRAWAHAALRLRAASDTSRSED